jgi:8-oxo-dGTP pyrophosphatase MutT (NUDIX family)
MGYINSYIWKLRQKIGRDLVITPTVDVLPINSKGQVKLAISAQFGIDTWSVVGGHVEPGDSWLSAALNELEEEAGIVAKPENLVPWATVSGAKRIFHYADGDTQPFTLIFLVKDWDSENTATDDEEVLENGWFDIDEALQMKLTTWCRQILLAYKEYSATGEFQMIEQDEIIGVFDKK